MIFKSYLLEKDENFLNDKSFILFYGENNGLKKDFKDKIIINNKNKEILNFYQEEIIKNNRLLYNEIENKSLFEKEKIIFINEANDKISEIIEQIIEKVDKEKIILFSNILEKKSKLRSLFEKSRKLICIPFYPDDDQTLSKLAFEFFKKRNILISQLNINQIVTGSLGSRENLYNELFKIENFSNSGKKLTDDVIKKLINLSENHSINELINNCLEKNKVKLIKILNENIYSNDDCIVILRALLNKSKKLLILSKEYEKNKNMDLTISTAKPPIFWKEKETTKRQIQNWKTYKLRLLIYKINELELIIKKNLNNSLNLITDFLLAQSVSKTNN